MNEWIKFYWIKVNLSGLWCRVRLSASDEVFQPVLEMIGDNDWVLGENWHVNNCSMVMAVFNYEDQNISGTCLYGIWMMSDVWDGCLKLLIVCKMSLVMKTECCNRCLSSCLLVVKLKTLNSIVWAICHFCQYKCYFLGRQNFLTTLLWMCYYSEGSKAAFLLLLANGTLLAFSLSN